MIEGHALYLNAGNNNFSRFLLKSNNMFIYDKLSVSILKMEAELIINHKNAYRYCNCISFQI